MGLYREVGVSTATALVIGNIVGAGIFTTSGLVAKDLGASPWLLGLWVLGGLLALAGAHCYARLGVAYPRAGGEYAFLLPTFGALPAFLSGWASLFIGFTAPLAACALGLIHYMAPLLGLSSVDGWEAKLGAAGCLWMVGGVLSLGLQTSSRLQFWLTAINVVFILAFVTAVWVASGDGSYLAEAVNGPLLPPNPLVLGSGLILVMFTYSGWNAAAYLAEEITNPARSLPIALLLGTGIVTLLYLAINAAYFAAAPLAEIAGRIPVAQIAASHVLGERAAVAVNLLIAVSLLSSLTAMSIAGPRVYFAMARDHLFPGRLAQVHPTRKIPLWAMWFQIAVATVFTLVGTLYEILLYSGFVLLFFSTLTVATLLLRPGTRWIPLLFVLANTAVLAAAAFSNPGEAAAGAATVAAALPVYRYYRRRSSSGDVATD